MNKTALHAIFTAILAFALYFLIQNAFIDAIDGTIVIDVALGAISPGAAINWIVSGYRILIIGIFIISSIIITRDRLSLKASVISVIAAESALYLCWIVALSTYPGYQPNIFAVPAAFLVLFMPNPALFITIELASMIAVNAFVNYKWGLDK